MATLTRAFRHRNYQLFFGGQLISLVGTWMQAVAESWLVFRLTGSSALLGVAAFAAQIPVFLVASIGGTVADRYNRHRIIVATQTCSMVLPLVLAALTLSGHVRVWHVFVLASLLGVVNGFDIPARQSFVVEMVGRDDLMNAIALNSSMFNGARAVGPAVAGVLVAAFGEGWCFLLNGLSYIAVIAGLLMMKLPAHERRASERPPWHDLVEGFRFAARTRPIRAILLLLGVVSFTAMPYIVLMPVFAESIMHAGPRGLGWLMSSAGAGAVIGALTVASRTDTQGLGRWIARAAGAFGVALVAFSLSRVFWLSAILLIPVGVAMMLQMASSNTLIQSMVPDHLRGRVMAVYSMMFMGMAPLGSLFAGSVAERIGAPATVALGGAITLAAALVFWSRLPSLRQEARALLDAQRVAHGEKAV